MFDLRPFHIISYGTLLGAEVFQTFIGGVTAYRVLPRPQFSTLQNAIFPIYFSLQAALPLVAALTFPGTTRTRGSEPSGIFGVIAKENQTNTLLPLTTVFVAGLINLLVLQPKASETIDKRKLQETIDGKRSYDPPPHSKEMTALNKKFSRLHGYSSLTNLMGLLATIYYGFVLGNRLY